MWAHGENFQCSFKQLASLSSNDTNKNHLVAKHSIFFPWTVQLFLAKKRRKKQHQKCFISSIFKGVFFDFHGEFM